MANKPTPKGTRGGNVDYRRADTGVYTTQRFAEAHPRITIRETRKK